MNQYIDTHSHLFDEDFCKDLDQVIDRAKEAGVIRVVMPGIDSSSMNRLDSVASKYPGYLFSTIGLHPTSVDEKWKSELDTVFSNFDKSRHIAIGEIGVDGYWSKDFIKEQKEIFEAQLRFASSHDLPVIIHSREATEEIFDVLESCSSIPLKGVFHAFSGSIETFKRISKYGNFKVGIGRVVTYKNSKLASTISQIPLDSIILETDAPWLTPAPYRGERNEPAYIPIIAQRIAEAKDIDVSLVADATTKNALEIFKI